MRSLMCLFVLITGCCFGQQRNNIWCFGDSSGIDFQNGLSTPIAIKSSVVARGSCASISDSIGNLLFYVYSNQNINDSFCGQVFNKNNLLMQNADSIIGDGWMNEYIIIPKNDSTKTYYIFTDGVTNNEGIWYSIVDLSYNNGLGKITNKNLSLLNLDIIGSINAIKHGNGRDWWLITHDWNSNNNFIEYLVTSDSIYGPYYQPIGSDVNTDVTSIKLSGDGNKLLLVDYVGLIELFDFDRCTGLITNPINIHTENLSNTNAYYFSCEFSPNNKFIYVNNSISSTYDTLGIIQYDITAANIKSTKKKIFQGNFPAVPGLMKLGPDRKIYLSCYAKCYTSQCFPYEDTLYNAYNTNLSVINYPDSPGVSCNFIPFSYYLGGYRTYYGLPNNPDYDMPALFGSPCDSLTGIENDVQNKNKLRVYPNPASNYLTFEFDAGKFSDALLTLFDITGRPINNYQLKGKEHSKTINIGDLSSGIYQYRIIYNKSFILSNKFIKIK